MPKNIVRGVSACVIDVYVLGARCVKKRAPFHFEKVPVSFWKTNSLFIRLWNYFIFLNFSV